MNLHTPLFFILVVIVAACTPVKPWQKEHLASPHMAFEANTTEGKYRRHLYESREGSRGGYGVGGGGCGCN